MKQKSLFDPRISFESAIIWVTDDESRSAHPIHYADINQAKCDLLNIYGATGILDVLIYDFEGNIITELSETLILKNNKVVPLNRSTNE